MGQGARNYLATNWSERGEPVTRASPQTRHKPKKAEPENGGFLRVTAEQPLVAKTAISDIYENNSTG
jgi:hypothetical protein